MLAQIGFNDQIRSLVTDMIAYLLPAINSKELQAFLDATKNDRILQQNIQEATASGLAAADRLIDIAQKYI